MGKKLTDSEWIILRALWDNPPLDLRTIVERVQEQSPDVCWDYKTYHSFLRILSEKGLVTADKQGRNNLYRAVITREQALSGEADSLASRRSYFGSVSSLMVSMAEQGMLTREEKRELMALAARLAQERDD